MLPISTEVLITELDVIAKVISNWRTKLEAGIPGEDLPISSEHQAEDFVRKLCGELLIVAGTCENMSNILSGNL